MPGGVRDARTWTERKARFTIAHPNTGCDPAGARKRFFSSLFTGYERTSLFFLLEFITLPPVMLVTPRGTRMRVINWGQKMNTAR